MPAKDMSAYMREWRKRHPNYRNKEKLKAANRRYYLSHKEKIHTINKAWRKRNREALKLKKILQLNTLAEARAILGGDNAKR
jgi:hypothetical protein